MSLSSDNRQKARLGPIQQFWFAETDTEPNWVVRLVCQDTLCRYVLTLRLGPIQQFWFAEPDTDTNWVVHLVCHNKLCRYVLTLQNSYENVLNMQWLACPTIGAYGEDHS